MNKLIIISRNHIDVHAIRNMHINVTWQLPESDRVSDLTKKTDIGIRRYSLLTAMMLARSLENEAKSQNYFVIGLSSYLHINKKIVSLPQNIEEASHLLDKLSGRRHSIYHALYLITPKGRIAKKAVETKVFTKNINKQEKELILSDFTKNTLPYDINRFGAVFVKSIIGNPNALEGIPIYELYLLLYGNSFFS